jgi:hypothetical protein
MKKKTSENKVRQENENKKRERRKQSGKRKVQRNNIRERSGK